MIVDLVDLNVVALLCFGFGCCFRYNYGRRRNRLFDRGLRTGRSLLVGLYNLIRRNLDLGTFLCDLGCMHRGIRRSVVGTFGLHSRGLSSMDACQGIEDGGVDVASGPRE